MAKQFETLLSPIQIGRQTYKNRIIRAPKGPVMVMPDGNVHPMQLKDAANHCDGGVAEFCIGETSVSAASARDAREFYGFLDLSPEHTKPYVDYCNVIHEHGAKAMIELCHTGRYKQEPSEANPGYGPMDCINENGGHIKAMTKEIIQETTEDFAAAAVFMQHCGFDGVCLHAGHGWLPHQFLSTRWNQRTDEFGGSLENRSRLSVMILKAIREACGEEFILEVRLSGQENVEDGYDFDTIVGYAKQIEPYIDMIHVSAGIYNKPMETKMMSTLYDLHGCNVEAAAVIKKAVSIPVAVVGGINDPAAAENWIRDGKCDLVVMCRALDADFDWIKKASEGKAGEIRKCVRCMRCFPGPHEEAMAELNGEFPEGCSINPYAKHGDLTHAGDAKEKKKLLVIGAGIAGMQAAITAANRGHQVTLAEKSGELGGILNFAKNDRDKYDLKGLADSMAEEVRNRDIFVEYNKELSEEELKEYEYVIIAIGSSPLCPPIPGIETCMQAMEAYDPKAKIGEKVIMLGGGLVGTETAIHLAKQGKQLAIVEMRNELAPDAYRLHKHKVRQLIAGMDEIETYLNTKCLSVDGGKVRVEATDGQIRELEADTVVNALGMKANPTSELKEMLEKAGIPYREIGDCKKARKIFDAVEEGFMAAMEL